MGGIAENFTGRRIHLLLLALIVGVALSACSQNSPDQTVADESDDASTTTALQPAESPDVSTESAESATSDEPVVDTVAEDESDVDPFPHLPLRRPAHFNRLFADGTKLHLVGNGSIGDPNGCGSFQLEFETTDFDDRVELAMWFLSLIHI